MLKSADRPTPERFLVISTTAIGDTLMGTPALRALRKSFPESRIDVLVSSRRKELLRGNPDVDRIIPYHNNRLYREFLAWRLRRRFYDRILIFHANDDVLELLRGLQYGECLSRQNFSDPERRIYRLEDLPPHSIQKRMALVERAGGKNSAEYQYTLNISEAAGIWAQRCLSRWGVSAKDLLVGLQLGANDAFKCWPVEFFAEVARHLRSVHGAKIFVNASRPEKPLVHRFLKLTGGQGVFFHVGGNLSRSAALIRACSLFISPDTGPMHLAMGLGIPLIALFGPTDPLDTGPLGNEMTLVIHKSPSCDPCRTRSCGDNFCMRQISVAEVCEAADRILRSRKKDWKGGSS